MSSNDYLLLTKTSRVWIEVEVKGGKMKGCKGCIYESDMKDMLARGFMFWASSEEHPCMYCVRYPREPLTEDNYVGARSNEKI